MKALSNRLTDYYISKNIIKPEMKETCAFGIELIANDVISCSLIFLTSVIAGFALQGIIFLTVFYITRVRCGGFHAKKVWRCRMTMLITFISVMAVFYCLKPLGVSWYTIIISNILSVLLLLPIIPVENPNKRLSSEVRSRNRKIGIVTILVCIVLSCALNAFEIYEGVLISLTLLSTAILAVIGKILNQRSFKNE